MHYHVKVYYKPGAEVKGDELRRIAEGFGAQIGALSSVFIARNGDNSDFLFTEQTKAAGFIGGVLGLDYIVSGSFNSLELG